MLEETAVKQMLAGWLHLGDGNKNAVHTYVHLLLMHIEHLLHRFTLLGNQ